MAYLFVPENINVRAGAADFVHFFLVIFVQCVMEKMKRCMIRCLGKGRRYSVEGGASKYCACVEVVRIHDVLSATPPDSIYKK